MELLYTLTFYIKLINRDKEKAYAKVEISNIDFSINEVFFEKIQIFLLRKSGKKQEQLF